jgi:hypothetical protein
MFSHGRVVSKVPSVRLRGGRQRPDPDLQLVDLTITGSFWIVNTKMGEVRQQSGTFGARAEGHPILAPAHPRPERVHFDGPRRGQFPDGVDKVMPTSDLAGRQRLFVPRPTCPSG